MTSPNWDDLRRPGLPPAERESAQVRRFTELSADLFVGGLGKEWLDIVRARYVERRVPPGASEAILREAEAVRGFIFTVEQARDHGLAARQKPKPPAA